MNRWTAMLIALALAAGACGDDANDVASNDGGTDVSAGIDVAAEIAYLGSLAELTSDPITIDVDASPMTIELSDGTVLDVPENSFGEPTMLTVGLADVDLGRFELDGPMGRLYVVGTLEDVALAEPVTLSISGSHDGRRVFHYHDGSWSEVELGAGNVTVVPIRGFSTVQTAVFDREIAPSNGSPALPNGDTPAQYLRNCIFALGSWYAETYPGDESSEEVLVTSDSATNQAAYLCTTALIDRLSPSDQYVSVACVGDRIEELGGLDAAIAACAESDDDQPADGTDESAENAADEGAVQAPVLDDELVHVDSALYDVYSVEGTLDEQRISVIDGVLEVSVIERELTMTGTVLVEKSLFGYGVAPGPICTSVQAVDVAATVSIEAEMSFRLETTQVEPFEIKAYTDQCKPESWVRDAERHEEWMLDNGPASVFVTVENGTLVGSVNNGPTADNLERAD